jgi:putative phage-type endonuclease
MNDKAVRAHCREARENGSATRQHAHLRVTITRGNQVYCVSAGEMQGKPVELENVEKTRNCIMNAIKRNEVWIGEGAPERQSWLEWRRGGLGGSDVAALIGVSPWASPWDVWRSKRNPPEEKTNAAMTRGTRLEGAIAEWHRAETRGRLQDGKPCQHPDLPWMRGTPDCWVSDVGTEIKTTRSWDGWTDEQVPAVYRAQVQWYMAITGTPHWDLVAFCPMNDQLRKWRIQRDQKVIDRLIEVAGQWWQTHIVEGAEPDIDGSAGCAAGLLELHSEPRETMRDAAPEMEQLIDQWRQADATAKQSAAHAKKLQNQIKDLIGDDAGVQGSKGYVKWTRYTTSSLDSKALIEARPGLKALLEQYTKTRQASRLTVKWEQQ